MKICVLDPGIEDNKGSVSSNLGDLIIQRAVTREIRNMFSDADITRISTQSELEDEHIEIIRHSVITFVGGTNLLSSQMNRYKQWNISFKRAWQINNAVLLGVGWWQYQSSPNYYSKHVLKMSLSHDFMHSVRDQYTLKKMKEMGFNNVINTGCPTMWPLGNIDNKEYCDVKSPNVLVTLTDYYKDCDEDARLLEVLFANYETVYFWPQGRLDGEYVRELGYPVSILEHSLKSFLEFLDSDIDCDYVGTRLHGGIACLLRKKRALVIAVDNRAREISTDTNIAVLARKNVQEIEEWIQNPKRTEISINMSNIATWKEQFAL